VTQLSVLSDYEFELVVADLLSARDRRRYETFPRGADGGIDVRCRLRRGWHIVQCKHYPQSTLARVVRAARTERANLERLEPAKYTFVTSRRLTAAAKDKVAAALGPYAQGPESVLAEQDVLALLRAYPEVERQHVKLWLG
jgi:Restriction endonuclease